MDLSPQMAHDGPQASGKMLNLTKNQKSANQLRNDSTSLPSWWPALQTDRKTAGGVAGSACSVGTEFQRCGVKRSGGEGAVGSRRPHPQGVDIHI